MSSQRAISRALSSPEPAFPADASGGRRPARVARRDRRRPAAMWIAGLVAGTLAITGACGSPSSGSSSAAVAHDAGTGTSSATTKPDFARTFDIGGRKMYMECAGQGSPTVILVSGGGIAGDVWDSPLGKRPTVFPTVSEKTRTCVYDRPGTTRAIAEGGISRSDPVEQPVVPSASAADLHALLEASGETGPVVLAAHSYGGLVARYYANRYPDEVVGMVLIDSFSPELRDSMGDNWPAWIRWNAPSDAVFADYPDYERVDFDKALDEVDAAKAIKPMPMVVLTADAPYPAVQVPGVPADMNVTTRNAQDASQREMAQLVPGAKHVTETHSGHDIMLENPTLVSESVLEVVGAVRNHKTSLLEPAPAPAVPDQREDATTLAHKDFAGLVDIGGGRKIWATCKGQGSPTVVLLSGHGNGAEDWSLILDPDDPVHQTPGDDVSAGMGKIVPSDHAVFPTVAHTTRVCTYDRSDIRYSGDVTTPRPQPHTVDLDVSDLHSLLAAIGEQGPYVFVSHSYGGLVSTLYARSYPESIAGLVMVDTVSEVMEDLVTPGALQWWDDVNAATNDVVREGVMIKDAFAQINASGPMPKVPAIVLVADKPFRVDLIPPELLEGEHTTFADWQAMVNKLGANLGAKMITTTDSGHNIYLYNPKLVIDSIDEIVADVRTA